MIGLARLQHWFKNGSTKSHSAAYEIVCACGQICRGQRRARQQVVRCSACKRELFVLPASPLPRVIPPGGESVIAQRPPARSRLWLGPIAVVGLTLGFLAVAIVCWISFYVMAPRPPASQPISLADIESQVAEGRKSLAEGNYAEALESLTKAQSNLASQPKMFTPAERRRLAQLHRQAAILADWPREPLDRILSRTASLNEDEWRAVSASYRGKSTVLDLGIRRDAARQYQFNYTRPMAVVRLRLELHNQKLLDSLPLEEPQRVIFAVRIADIRREDHGGFLVRFDPDSAVLLTDVSAGIISDIPEAAFRTRMEQQQTWAADLP